MVEYEVKAWYVKLIDSTTIMLFGGIGHIFGNNFVLYVTFM